MKKPVILVIMMMVSFILSGAFFFSSGFFNLEKGQVTLENANSVAMELESLPFINMGEQYENREIVEVNETKILSLDEIETIEIESISTKVITRKTKEQEVSFNLVGTGTAHSLEVENNGDTIEVSIEYPNRLFGFGLSNLVLYVNIPEDYSEDLIIETTSGHIETQDLNLDEYSADSISGEIYSNNIIAEDCNFGSTSGLITSEKVVCKESKIKTISGGVRIIEGTLGDVETVSGKMYLENVEANRDVRLKSISGNIDLKQKKGTEQRVIFNSVSGKSSGINPALSSLHTISVKTTSGSLIVQWFYLF